MSWKSVLTLCLVGIGLLLGAYFYGHYQGKLSVVHAPADTSSSVTPTPIAPPETVYVRPNPVPAKPRPDLTDKRRVDSLTAVVLNKDSLIASLLTTQYAEPTFTADSAGFRIVGRLPILYYPPNREFAFEVKIDSLTVPASVREIVRYVVQKEMDWTWTTAIAGATVVLIEFLLHWVGR